ncbi:CBS domain-containing protein [Desulfoplanes formicivorans]|uniref:Histidine kinase n=1 Tax=Desulfoplanes formicivorans TaxID=1592317 RepID=A0A194AGN4_9BACT|nr:response regulator [Desulfoplanes formicivorans]GAU09237.1 histidine kinase [Desulfoplanes formicivorans]
MAKKIKVLMVDDEERFRSTTSKILERKGYEVSMAASAEEALDILKRTTHDVVVLDIKMPGLSGEEALPRIKEIDADIQVIMLTGHGGMESAQKSLTKGAFDYLNKPCDIDLLSARINDAYMSVHTRIPKEKTAAEIMIPIGEYTSVQADSTVREGIEKLKDAYEAFLSTDKVMESGHRAIIVFDGNEVVGVLTMQKLLEAIRPEYLSAPKPSMAESMQYSTMFWSGLFSSQVKKLKDRKIRDVMRECPPVVNEEANLMEVADTMYTQRRRRVMVEDGQQIIGVIREQELFYEISKIILAG